MKAQKKSNELTSYAKFKRSNTAIRNMLHVLVLLIAMALSQILTFTN